MSIFPTQIYLPLTVEQGKFQFGELATFWGGGSRFLREGGTKTKRVSLKNANFSYQDLFLESQFSNEKNKTSHPFPFLSWFSNQISL